MKRSIKRRLVTLMIYGIVCYLLLIPFKIWICAIPIALFIAYLFSLLNEILSQLRKLNGEKLKL